MTDSNLRRARELPPEWPADMGSRIEEAFSGIASEPLLRIAKEEQRALAARSGAGVREKALGERFTEADVRIQSHLLSYFAESAIAGLYIVKAEEELPCAASAPDGGPKVLQLIVDPLDGTEAFIRGEDTWGVMVGVADADGLLLASWNLTSSGELYTSFDTGDGPARSWERALSERGSLVFDVFDYGGPAPGLFPAALEGASGGWIRSDDLQIRSSPAAVIAGSDAVNGRIDGLLWLPGAAGKRVYPDYDLVFLGALQARGWRISLGSHAGEVLTVAAAPADAELELLERTGAAIDATTADLEHMRAAAVTTKLEGV